MVYSDCQCLLLVVVAVAGEGIEPAHAALHAAQLPCSLVDALCAVALCDEVHSSLLGFLLGELLCHHACRKQQQNH